MGKSNYYHKELAAVKKELDNGDMVIIKVASNETSTKWLTLSLDSIGEFGLFLAQVRNKLILQQFEDNQL